MKTPQKNKPDNNSNDDIALFRNYVKDIKPLVCDKVTHQSNRSNRITYDNSEDKIETLVDRLSDNYENRAVQAEDVLSFCRPGIQKRTFQKLRNGQLKIGHELDLHGLTVKQAKKTILILLRDSIYYGQYCILIIHGKGKKRQNQNASSILKTRLNSWLRQHNRVLAFHSTPQNQGGTGAIFLLLKKSQKSRVYNSAP